MNPRNSLNNPSPKSPSEILKSATKTPNMGEPKPKIIMNMNFAEKRRTGLLLINQIIKYKIHPPIIVLPNSGDSASMNKAYQME